jgi:predicted metal-binding protein
MNNGDCTDPNDPAKRLKQLLVHDGSGSYMVYSLTQDEARNVMLELKDYMKSRKGILDRSDAVIISH